VQCLWVDRVRGRCCQQSHCPPGTAAARGEVWGLGLHWDVGWSCLFGLTSYQVGCLDGPVFTPRQLKTVNYLLNDL